MGPIKTSSHGADFRVYFEVKGVEGKCDTRAVASAGLCFEITPPGRYKVIERANCLEREATGDRGNCSAVALGAAHWDFDTPLYY